MVFVTQKQVITEQETVLPVDTPQPAEQIILACTAHQMDIIQIHLAKWKEIVFFNKKAAYAAFLFPFIIR